MYSFTFFQQEWVWQEDATDLYNVYMRKKNYYLLNIAPGRGYSNNDFFCKSYWFTFRENMTGRKQGGAQWQPSCVLILYLNFAPWTKKQEPLISHFNLNCILFLFSTPCPRPPHSHAFLWFHSHPLARVFPSDYSNPFLPFSLCSPSSQSLHSLLFLCPNCLYINIQEPR